MNMHQNHTPARPLGFWLKTVDRLLSKEFATAFEAEAADRRTWRFLNIVDGSVAPRRPLDERRLRPLLDRGWAVRSGDGFALTDEGRAAKARMAEVVDGIRSRVTEAVPTEDLATTLSSLEQIARAFGWSEDSPHERGHCRQGFGRHHRSHRHGDHGLKLARFGQRSYERGFEAGFTRGREA